MDIFEIVADPTRRAIIDLLAKGEQTAGKLVDAFPTLTQPAVSRHLRILRESRLVDTRISAQHRIYSLRPERLIEIDKWLNRYRNFWAQSLDSLEEHLARKHAQKSPNMKRTS